MNLRCNCCDGIYKSFDVHFTSACDNKCKHCIDRKCSSAKLIHPNAKAIAHTIINNSHGMDDVLFLGGEPCLFLDSLYECVAEIRDKTSLKIYVTTSVPYICYTQYNSFLKLIDILDGINISVQHYQEETADKIRGTISQYDRQKFYKELPEKNKIRINLNIVQPYLCTTDSIVACLRHYDAMKFSSIKLSEIQHSADSYISFESLFNLKLPSAYAHGCQTYLNTSQIIPDMQTPVLLKRSCFACETSLRASFSDGVKTIIKTMLPKHSKYGVVYEDGTLLHGWR